MHQARRRGVEALTITDRNVTLSGVLADGSAFAFDLNSAFVPGTDFFATLATLTVTLVPCRADINADSAIDAGDVTLFVNAFNASNPAADIDANGSIDFADVTDFIAAFNQGCP